MTHDKRSFASVFRHLARHAGTALALARDGETPLPRVTTVECGACTACCWMEGIMLTPAEKATGRYALDEHGHLAKRADGGCVYLHADGKGCSIYEHRPMVCRAFDCRVTTLIPGEGIPEVMQAARDRVQAPHTGEDLVACVALAAAYATVQRRFAHENRNDGRDVMLALEAADAALPKVSAMVRVMPLEQMKSMLRTARKVRGFDEQGEEGIKSARIQGLDDKR